MSGFQRFGIIGGGAWGTALGMALLRAGRDVVLWAREKEVVSSINEQHENAKFFAGVALDPNLSATGALAELTACDALLLVVPTQYLRGVCKEIAKVRGDKKRPLVLCAKGIEQNTLLFPSQVVEQELPGHIVAVLSGPTFAAEVAKEMPTATTVACADQEIGDRLTHAIGSKTFRPYLSNDVIGAQIGGAIKNVLAVAAGIAVGCGMGDNARAALITRGLAEMMRLGAAIGAQHETLMGLSGVGDLVLTCSSMQSRNMSLGVALGQGKTLAEILASRSSVAEGVATASAAKALADKCGVEMPIVAAVDAVLNHGAKVDVTIAGLLARPLRAEGA